MNPGQETTAFGDAAIKIGIFSVVAAALLGLGSLGYYGCGLSHQPSALDHIKSGTWSEQVKDNIQTTYTYFFFSFYICIMSAIVVFCDPVLFRVFSSAPMALVDIFVQSSVQHGRTFARLNSQGTFSTQRLAWVSYCVFLGGITSPAFLLGLNSAKLSVHLTCVIAGVLVIISLVAPAGKYLAWKQTLSVSEVAVFIGSVGAALFPLRTSPGALFFSMSFYGGLILFPLHFLCHSQEAQIMASEARSDVYCAMAMSVPMLLDVISIFSRIVVMVPPT